MRVLIVGGGMAGWTLAAHLRRRGHTPIVVERVAEYTRKGFSIGLYPFSANTLRESGVYSKYENGSMSIEDYVMNDASGEELQRMSFAEVLGSIGGSMGALERADLLEILIQGGNGSDLRMNTRVTSIEQADDVVRVELSDGNSLEVDLVVGADGIHSEVRRMVFGENELKDWSFTAFTWWSAEDDEVSSNVIEHWGAGGLFGLYPLPGRVNAIAGMPTPEGLREMDQPAIRDYIRAGFAEYPDVVQRAISHLEDGEILPWAMTDQRASRWIDGRVALVGDAATAFLPTAGVGASNAIKSAAVLGDELGRADEKTIPQALDLWEKRMRTKVEANQHDSRQLAKMMFVKGHTVARIRDVLLKHYPVEKVAKQVLESNTTPF